jgi:Na+-transporting methylmalonyl-CoA/oxaloacetate decarboxylase gamma subunit
MCYVQSMNALLFILPLGVAVVFAFLTLRTETRR